MSESLILDIDENNEIEKIARNINKYEQEKNVSYYEYYNQYKEQAGKIRARLASYSYEIFKKKWG